jgi:hypothetical protein
MLAGATKGLLAVHVDHQAADAPPQNSGGNNARARRASSMTWAVSASRPSNFSSGRRKATSSASITWS